MYVDGDFAHDVPWPLCPRRRSCKRFVPPTQLSDDCSDQKRDRGYEPKSALLIRRVDVPIGVLSQFRWPSRLMVSYLVYILESAGHISIMKEEKTFACRDSNHVRAEVSVPPRH